MAGSTLEMIITTASHAGERTKDCLRCFPQLESRKTSFPICFLNVTHRNHFQTSFYYLCSAALGFILLFHPFFFFHRRNDLLPTFLLLFFRRTITPAAQTKKKVKKKEEFRRFPRFFALINKTRAGERSLDKKEVSPPTQPWPERRRRAHLEIIAPFPPPLLTAIEAGRSAVLYCAPLYYNAISPYFFKKSLPENIKYPLDSPVKNKGGNWLPLGRQGYPPTTLQFGFVFLPIETSNPWWLRHLTLLINWLLLTCHWLPDKKVSWRRKKKLYCSSFSFCKRFVYVKRKEEETEIAAFRSWYWRRRRRDWDDKKQKRER